MIGEIVLDGTVISFDLTKTQKDPYHIRCNTRSSKGNQYRIYKFTIEKNSVSASPIDEKLIRGEWATHSCPFTHETK